MTRHLLPRKCTHKYISIPTPQSSRTEPSVLILTRILFHPTPPVNRCEFMDKITAVRYRHTRSPSGRFITVLSPPSDAGVIFPADELSEEDVLYNNDKDDDFPDPPRDRHCFRQPEKFGILVALPEDHRNPEMVIQKQSFSSSREIPGIPKPRNPMRRVQQSSAPVKVPMMVRKKDHVGDAVDGEDQMMLPPHEMATRGSVGTTTFSVLEGAGRTLKGRDLRRVRNAVLRHTGFLD